MTGVIVLLSYLFMPPQPLVQRMHYVLAVSVAARTVSSSVRSVFDPVPTMLRMTKMQDGVR